jgi:predicted secreted Zn-dependent protease
MGDGARDRRGDHLVGAGGDGNDRRNVVEDQQRRDQEAAADAEHAGQEADGRAHAEDDENVHRQFCDGQIDCHCVLVSAKPKLIVFYTLPKPSAPLVGPLKNSWDAFLDGVRKHEKVHGETIVDMVRKIEAMSVGLSAQDDPDCRQIRVDLTKRLGELSARQRQLGRDFDRTEMSEGGNIQALILKLVNGP